MIGQAIGNFVVKSRLGRGGMGEVFLAEHKDLQTPVAIKILNADISDDRDHVQRFFNEARVVSKIKHAGTIKIFDSGYVNGHAYLVMELLEGESLNARMSKLGTLPVKDVLDIGQQIASVLEATHRQGVIHRDLKPDNIYLVHDDERETGERVKILDFGIAKLSGTMAAASPKTSGTMGTPTYMAPEQWGDSSAVDWRADAYSLGCVAFEMATGRPPFIVETIPEAYTKHVHEKAPSARSFRPDLPAALDALLARLLAKSPAERATSMGEVASSFAAIAGRRVSAPATAVGPEASAPTQRAVVAPTLTTLGGSAVELQTVAKSRRLAIGGGIAAGMLVVGIVVLAATRPKETKEPPPAPAPAPAAVAAPAPAPVLDAAPAPVAVAVPDAAPAPVVPVDAAIAAVHAPPPPPPPPVKKKTVKAVRPDAGAAVKKDDDDQWGGRL